MATGTATSLASTIASKVAAIVNAIIVARILNVSDVGVFAIVGLVVAVASVTSSAGVGPALVKFLSGTIPNRSQEMGRLIGAGLVIVVIATVASLGVLAASLPVLAGNVYHDSRITGLAIAACVGLILSNLVSPFFATFQGMELITELNFRDIAVSIFSIPVTLLMVHFYGLLGAVLVSATVGVMAILVKTPLLLRVRREKELHIVIPRDPQTYRTILNFAVPYISSALMVTPILLLCNTILANSYSFTELGLYSVGNSLVGYLPLISISIGIPMVPLVSRLHRENPREVPQFMMKTFRIAAYLTLPATVILAAFPKPFLEFMYGDQYEAATGIVSILAPAMLLSSLAGIVGYTIAGVGRMWHGFGLNLIWGILFVVMSLLLIPEHAGVGLAAAFLGAYVGHFFAVLIYIRAVWSVRVSGYLVPLTLAGVAIPAAMLLSMLTFPWNYASVATLLAAIMILGAFAMPEHEFRILIRPLGMAASWIGRSH